MATDKSIKRIKLDEATTIDEEIDSVDEEDSSSGEEETVYLEDWSFVGDTAQHDLTLIVEEHKIHVSKTVLCLASPVFRAMFEGGFKEKDMQEVKLPDKKYEDFAEFLRCIYPNTLKSITETNVCQVLPYVMEYQMSSDLQKRCQTSLIKVVRKNPEDVFKYIGLAELYDIEDLRIICVYIASESSLQCFEKATSLISAKSLFQIHLLNLKRNALNIADDEMLLKDGRVDKKFTGNSIKTVYTETIKNYITSYWCYGGDQIRRVRLSYRYNMPELLSKKLLDTDKIKNSSSEIEEALSLLPESVKQSMDISDEHQYLYPPLPDIPKPESSNKKPQSVIFPNSVTLSTRKYVVY